MQDEGYPKYMTCLGYLRTAVENLKLSCCNEEEGIALQINKQLVRPLVDINLYMKYY